MQSDINWAKLLEDCIFLKNSTMEMSIEFPREYDLAKFKGLRSKIIRFAEVGNTRIKELKLLDDSLTESNMMDLFFDDDDDEDDIFLALNKLHRATLPHIKNLRTLWVFSKADEKLSEIYQNLINNNTELENLALHEVKLAERTHCSNLIRLDFVACRGAVSALI